MKVRGLVPDELFNEDKIKEILVDISPNEATYYKAILQNLFFATLNTKQEQRKFRAEVRGYKGYNPDFGNHGVYRHLKLFKNPESIEEYFGKIPFLNGGLFECLDYKSKLKEERVYIDGFTDTAKHQPFVPNFLLFSGETETDLNKEFGTKNKSYKVRGLIDILSSYNFTIDENEADDQEIALDPELLGKVFENLLASYTPETATTARKSTGSYYTPRKIVDYMVTQSLIHYFKSHLSPEIELDTKLTELFSTQSLNNPFDADTTKQIIQLIESLRIIDPAVGSGAFPMGTLNKLVFILFKLDPQNILWKQAQLNAIKQNVTDPIVQKRLILQVEKQFEDKNADYGRKLYLIEKCIYGVDIQQIAVEIAKLRFFISLLVDEKIDFQKHNYGIEPLPNLDFKLMQGNSLISSFAGIDFDRKTEFKEQGTLQLDTRNDHLIKQFEEAKNQYQNEPDKKSKDALRKEIEDMLIQIFEEKIKQHLPQLKNIEEIYAKMPNQKQRIKLIATEKEKVWKKLGFDLEQAEKDLIVYTEGRKPKDFFLWSIYFAEVFQEKGGFDVVIGNPPYVSVKEISTKDKNIFGNVFETGQGRFNLFTLFLEKADQILKPQGIRTFILPEGLYSNIEYRYIRKHILENSSILFIILFSNRVFDAAVDTSIISTQKVKKADNQFPVIRDLKDCLTIINQNLFNNFPANLFVVNLNDESKKIIFKLFNIQGEKIESILEIQQGVIYSGQIKENVFSNNKIDKNYKKILV